MIMFQPVYILKTFEEGKTSTKMHDNYDHVILPDELYLRGNYLVKTRCRNITKRKSRTLDDPVLVKPDYFIDVKEHKTIEADLYIKLSEHATV